MSRVYTQINLKIKIGIKLCKTTEELYEWAKNTAIWNYIFELNFVRIMSKKSRKMTNKTVYPKRFTKEF